MKVSFQKSFKKDLLKILNTDLLQKIREIIEQVEQAEQLSEVNNVKKLKGKTGYYRIRVGDYRVGIKVCDREVLFVRILHRKAIYRYFP